MNVDEEETKVGTSLTAEELDMLEEIKQAIPDLAPTAIRSRSNAVRWAIRLGVVELRRRVRAKSAELAKAGP